MNKKILKIFIVLLLSLSFLLISGCKKSREEPIVFDNSHPLALAPDVKWALITDPYASYKIEPSWDAENGEHCRKGEILMIEGKTKVKNPGKKKSYTDWYLFKDGWLAADCLTVYDNRYRAEKAGEKIAK